MFKEARSVVYSFRLFEKICLSPIMRLELPPDPEKHFICLINYKTASIMLNDYML